MKKTETKTEKANTPAGLIAIGELVVLDEVMSKKAGIVVKVAMPKRDYLALEIDKAMGEKKSKKVKALLNAYTDYVDHDKSVRPSGNTDKWADSILFGSAAEAKRKALQVVSLI